MSKPDWKDAPQWARYLAKNSNGDWWWHELKPEVDNRRGLWHSNGLDKLAYYNKDWIDSLEENPHD